MLLRSIVAIVCLLAAAQSAFVTQGLYVYLVTYRGNVTALLRPQWALSAQVYVTELSNFLVRSVFAHRMWKLSDRRLQRALAPVVVFGSTFVLGTGFVFGTAGIQTKAWSDNQDFAWSVFASYGAEMVTDGVIAASMSMMLRERRTGISSSDSVVQKFMAYSIYTGLLTAICVLVTLVTYIIDPKSFVYLAFYFVFSKLYTISLLGWLNARTLLHESKHQPTDLLTTNVLIVDDSQPSIISLRPNEDVHLSPRRSMDSQETASFDWAVVRERKSSGSNPVLHVVTTHADESRTGIMLAAPR